MNIRDNNVSLRDFCETDIAKKVRWINDPENNEYLHYDLPLEYDKTVLWYRNKNNETRLDLIIEYENIPVGLIGLLNIDYFHKKAEFYICLGEKQYKGCGIAKIATKLLVNYVFEEINHQKIYLNVDADNIRACYLYERVGFTCEGYFKKDMIHHGQYIDRKRYAIFSESVD